jgi:Ankyrin repeats (many copies)/Ankyrin repeat
MIDEAAPTDDSQQRALRRLVEAIAARKSAAALRLLAKTPALARLAVHDGATRAVASEHFFESISHYVYTGDTALHVAGAAYQREIAEALLANRANVSARNRRGAEPLHYACDGVPGSAGWDPEAQSAVIVLLIEAGAEPNSEDKSGVTPLHRAVRTRCAGAVRALLTNGADALRKNKNGSTPLHLAVQNTGRSNSGSTAARDEQAAVIRLLLEYGARASDRDGSGRSVQECAKADWIRVLLAARASR